MVKGGRVSIAGRVDMLDSSRLSRTGDLEFSHGSRRQEWYISSVFATRTLLPGSVRSSLVTSSAGAMAFDS